MEKIVECVPNFSEGRNQFIIDEIVAKIKAASYQGKNKEEKVTVLDIDRGESANRTVITFAGSPEAVEEAAFAGAKAASELIDMRQHHGTHPRSGALDVLPFVPIKGVTLQECAEIAKRSAKRIYEELGIPCYLYEAAAQKPERKNLAITRAGGYEALSEKILDPKRKPDFSPEKYNETVAISGATNIGARNFLVAVNFNLNTTSTKAAMEIAYEIRESGRPAMKKDSLTNKTLKDATKDAIRIQGKLKGVKAIGWYIKEYGISQVSVNITDINTSPLHVVFETVAEAACNRGLRVTGTEIIGLLPKSCLIDAGKHFLGKQQSPIDISEEEIIKTAINTMGLEELRPFNPNEKVIETLFKKTSLYL